VILVIGGAYQGKLSYVKEKYRLEDQDIYICKEGQSELTTDKRVIYGLEHIILSQVKKGMDSTCYIKENIASLQDKILVCVDASCGIVPMDKDLRAYREASGRTLSYLANKADEVIRIFCGIGSKIK